MKLLSSLFVCLLPTIVWAQQLLTPYTAAEAVSYVTRTASQNGMRVTGIDAIFTSGDSTLLALLGGTIGSFLQLSFDFQRGTSTAWIYSVKGTINGRDTSIYYLVVKFVVAYQAIPLGGGFGLNELDSLRGRGVLPSGFLNSDQMVRKLATNPVFLTYRQQYPASILLGASLSTTPDTLPPRTTALWSLLIGEGTLYSPRPPILNCYISATDPNESAVCFELGTTFVDNESAPPIMMYPNPAQDAVFLKLPPFYHASDAIVEILQIDGRLLTQHAIVKCSSNEIVALSVSSLPPGIYLLRCRTKEHVRTLQLVVNR